MPEQEIKLDLHAIQVSYLEVTELYIKSTQPASPEVGIDADRLRLRRVNTDYDPETHNIGVRVTVETGEGELPYELRVAMSAIFEVDESKFPREHIEHWAKHNAVFIVYPYLREHIYALTMRAGFAPAILPLVEIPTYQVPKV